MKCLFKILFLLIICSKLVAQDISVPVNVQMSLFYKILAYDKGLASRVKDHFDILIVYQKKYRTSLNIKNSIESILEKDSYKSIKGIPVQVKFLSIETDRELEDYVKNNHTDCIYLTPLRAVNISNIVSITRSMKILSITGVEEYIGQGISVGIGAKGEKPQIIINLPSSKMEGSDFSSQLLKLAKIIE